MNDLFRNIKENSNLDLLEESDDEDEFENISETKYVDMNKSVVMNCEFNTKFKRWEPTTITDKYTKLTTLRDVNEIENKFKRNNRKPHFYKIESFKIKYYAINMENKKPTIEKKSSYESLGEEFPNFEETAEYDELQSVILEKLRLAFWDKMQDEIKEKL